MARDLDIKTQLMGKGLIISTVFLGHAGYETAVFHRKTGGERWDSEQYKTELQARRGHRDVVSWWKQRPRSAIRHILKKITIRIDKP